MRNDIVNHFRSTSYPLLFFPEGWDTNGEVGLMQFQKFLFGVQIPIQPTSLRSRKGNIKALTSSTQMWYTSASNDQTKCTGDLNIQGNSFAIFCTLLSMAYQIPASAGEPEMRLKLKNFTLTANTPFRMGFWVCGTGPKIDSWWSNTDSYQLQFQRCTLTQETNPRKAILARLATIKKKESLVTETNL